MEWLHYGDQTSLPRNPFTRSLCLFFCFPHKFALKSYNALTPSRQCLALSGYPTLGIEMQGLENPALRRFLSLPDSLSGILVTHVSELSCCRPAVQVGDVLTEIDGKSIGDDGTVAFPVELLGSAREGGVQRDERIDMEFLVTEHQVGDSCTLTLFRKGAIVKSEITLTAPDPLIPPEGKRVKRGLEHLKLPSYRLVGGLVLTVLTDALIGAETHLGGTTGTAIASAILAPYFEPPKRFKDEEAVICGGVLAHGSTVGYEGLIMLRLGSVNGEPVRNLKQVSQVIDTAVRNGVKAREEGATEGRYLQLEFERGPIAVLDTWNLPQDTAEVLELHMVPKDRSEDLGDGAGLVGKASKEGWMMGRL